MPKNRFAYFIVLIFAASVFGLLVFSPDHAQAGQSNDVPVSLAVDVAAGDPDGSIMGRTEILARPTTATNTPVSTSESTATSAPTATSGRPTKTPVPGTSTATATATSASPTVTSESTVTATSTSTSVSPTPTKGRATPTATIPGPTATATATSTSPASAPPVANDDQYSVASGAVLDTASQSLNTVLDNDFDADNDPLTAVLVEDVINGELVLNADGSFLYEHSGNDAVSLPLLPGSDNSNVEYGTSTAIDGDTLVIGSNSPESGRTNAGSVYVFVREGVNWKLQAKLLAAGPAVKDRFFGWAVDISGDTIIVGAPGDSSPGKKFAGAIYVFVRDGASWTQQAKLFAGDGAAGDEFGGSVAISGDTIVAGAYYNDHSELIDPGAAYVFQRSGTSWSQQAKLTAAEPSNNDWLGLGLDIDGDTIVVGALNDDEEGINAGAAYIYQRSGSIWTQQQKLTASDATAGHTFGFAAALQDDVLVIGANGYLGSSDYAGAAYVFTRSGNTWTQQQKLVEANATPPGFFGFGVAVAVSGETILVGAHGHDQEGENAGAAYLFGRQGGNWVLQEKMFALIPVAGSEFGVTVAVDGDYAVLGANSDKFAPQADQQPGYAYVYQIGGTLTDSFTYKANDGSNDSNVARVSIILEP